MDRSPVASLLSRLFGAVLLGVGAIFQPKARPDDHWSTSPKVQAEADDESEASGGPAQDRRPGSGPRLPRTV